VTFSNVTPGAPLAIAATLVRPAGEGITARLDDAL
jgi:hypothetical protein